MLSFFLEPALAGGAKQPHHLAAFRQIKMKSQIIYPLAEGKYLRLFIELELELSRPLPYRLKALFQIRAVRWISKSRPYISCTSES